MNTNFSLLSNRERQVLKLLAKGFSVKQVANSLHITSNTSSQYTKSIYLKLGIHCRAQAVIKAVDLGLISLPA